MPRLSTQSTVARQCLLVAKPLILEVPLAIDASIATRCEIGLSPGTGASPLIDPRPLILIDLDITTSGMLHNDAPCDYLTCQTARFDLTEKVEEERHPAGR